VSIKVGNRGFGISLRTGERAGTRLGKNFKLHIIALRRDRAERHFAGSSTKNFHGGVIDDRGIDGRNVVFFWGGGNEEREKEEEEANDFWKARRVGFPVATLFERWERSAVIDRHYRGE
jgi:hypothetical protein